MSENKMCPCGSGKAYSECCEPIIKGKVKAPNAESVMRARYSSYVKQEIDYIINSCSEGDGIAEIDKEKCIGCGKCANECPKNIISLIPDKRYAVIKCMSKDKGVVVKNYCEAGCIACRICEKKCPKEAIAIENKTTVRFFIVVNGIAIALLSLKIKTLH